MFIGIFILNFKGDLVYAKPHREEMTKFILDLFRVNIIDQRGTTPLPPVNRIDKYNYIHMTLNDGLYIMGVIHNYANIIAALEFLKTIKNIIKYICGTVNETAISNKRFILVEILQETCSYGFPQITDLSVLKEWVFETIAKKSSKKSSNSSITNQITGQITWRKQGLKYSTHSLFLSVFEKVNVVVSATGQPLSSSVDGKVIMKSKLSGMPECKCGINNKVPMTTPADTHPKKLGVNWIALDDCSFHQCVRLSSFESERSISFIPPDGKFELMRYRTTQDIQIPFRVIPMIREMDASLNLAEITLILKSLLKPEMSASNIKVTIPVPSNTARAEIRQSNGVAIHAKSENAIIWKIRKMNGCKEYTISAKLDLYVAPSLLRVKKEARPPVTLRFEVPFSCSGLTIRYLKVYESKLNYSDKEVTKWVRYVTSEGKYEFRI